MHKYLVIDQWGHPGTFLVKEIESQSMISALEFLNRSDLYESDLDGMLPEYARFIHGHNDPEVCILIIKLN